MIPTSKTEITQLLAKNASLRQHWADDDTRIKEITKSVLPNFDTDGGGYFVDMVECAEAMAARIRELEGKWLPIESAPRDGTKVCLAAFCDEQERWVFRQDYWRAFADGYGAGWGWSAYFPAYWQPLPQPPKETAGPILPPEGGAE